MCDEPVTCLISFQQCCDLRRRALRSLNILHTVATRDVWSAAPGLIGVPLVFTITYNSPKTLAHPQRLPLSSDALNHGWAVILNTNALVSDCEGEFGGVHLVDEITVWLTHALFIQSAGVNYAVNTHYNSGGVGKYYLIFTQFSWECNAQQHSTHLTYTLC